MARINDFKVPKSAARFEPAAALEDLNRGACVGAIAAVLRSISGGI